MKLIIAIVQDEDAGRLVSDSHSASGDIFASADARNHRLTEILADAEIKFIGYICLERHVASVAHADFICYRIAAVEPVVAGSLLFRCQCRP